MHSLIFNQNYESLCPDSLSEREGNWPLNHKMLDVYVQELHSKIIEEEGGMLFLQSVYA